MKNFQNYTPEKYAAPAYRLVEEGVYLTAKPKNMLFGFPYESKEHYVTSLSFEMEPESFGEEGAVLRTSHRSPLRGSWTSSASISATSMTSLTLRARRSVIRSSPPVIWRTSGGCAPSSAGGSTPRRSPTPAETRRTGRWLSNNPCRFAAGTEWIHPSFEARRRTGGCYPPLQVRCYYIIYNLFRTGGTLWPHPLSIRPGSP